MKFAQVEFTAVLSTVLRASRIEPALNDGSVRDDAAEYGELARKQVLSVIRDSALHGPTLTMGKPQDLWLKVTKR